MWKQCVPSDALAASTEHLLNLECVIAALFGVQTEQNRQRDFQHGKPALYMTIGVGFIVLFVLSLLLIVNWVLA